MLLIVTYVEGVVVDCCYVVTFVVTVGYATFGTRVCLIAFARLRIVTFVGRCVGCLRFDFGLLHYTRLHLFTVTLYARYVTVCYTRIAVYVIALRTVGLFIHVTRLRDVCVTRWHFTPRVDLRSRLLQLVDCTLARATRLRFVCALVYVRCTVTHILIAVRCCCDYVAFD